MGADLPVGEGARPAVRALKRALWRLRPVQSLHHLVRARRDAASLDPRHPDRLPILVHQMAKVGSSTVQATLEALDPPRRPCLKVHFLSPQGVRRERALDRRIGGPLYVSYYGAAGRALGSRLRRVGGHLQVPVVSLVRDPIAREVSGVFQVPELAGARRGRTDLDAERALAHLESLFARGEACLGADRWFDDEMRDVFGIDVFARDFPRERGFAIVSARRARLLLLRTEDLDQTLAPALQEFLDLPKPPAIVRANQRERAQGTQAVAYRRVLERFRLPADVVDEIYARRLCRHFYSDAMLADFRRRWVR